METRAKYVTIGFFALAVIAAAFGFVYWLDRLSEAGNRADILFEFEGSVSGLAPGSVVQFAGIRVGDVTAVSIDPDDPSKINVTASVRQDAPIRTDTRAEVASSLLTGIAYIEMSGGSPGAPSIFTEDPPKIVGSRSAMSDVIAQAGATVTKVEDIAERIDRILETNGPAIDSTVDNVRTFTAALADNADGIKDFLANVAALSETVGGLSERLGGVVEKADGILAAVDPTKVRSAIDNADAVMSRIANASGEIETIIGDVTSAVQSVTQFIDELNTTLSNVQAVVTSVDRDELSLAVTNLSEFSESLNKATPDLDAMVTEARRTIANASEFTANLNAKEGDFNTIIANAKTLSERLNTSAARLDSVLGKADDLLGTGDGAGSRNFFQEASAAAVAIREAAQTISRETDRIGGGLSTFSTRGLADITALVNELRASIARIDRTIVQISADPAGAFFGGGSDVREYNRR